MDATKLRSDIQTLRGIAVAMVVLYHFDIGGLASGYLGVDIFFVISGYLITTLIAQSIERGDFRLSDFYFRRAKRLLPAAYATFLITALCAPWFLSQQDLKDFSLQMIGAVTFTANVFLWQQSGYFEGASELKPLLHTWSLSLEEQFYLLLPAALLLLPRRRWSIAVALALLASLGACLVGIALKPIAAFYLLPTRAWELLIGSAGALLVATPVRALQVSQSRLIRSVFHPSLACLLLLPFVPMDGGHPGLAAVLACLATLVVILRRDETFGRAGMLRGLGLVGHVSYSLYLVHWPILAFMRNAWIGDAIPWFVRLPALGLSVLLAVLLYRHVENPIRKASLTPRYALVASFTMLSILLVCITPLAMQLARSDPDFAKVRRMNFGLSEACGYASDFVPKTACISGPGPRVLVWGDSYAMHLVPGLQAQLQATGLVQATRSSCGPIVGVGPWRLQNPASGLVYDRSWAHSCMAFNQSVIDYLKRSPHLDTVVLSSTFMQYVSDEWRNLVTTADGVDERTPTVGHAAAGLKLTIDQLRAAGKKVVVIAPPPTADYNIGACLERKLSGRVTVGQHGDCRIAMDDYQRQRRGVLDLMEAIEREGVPVIRMSDLLCNARFCETLLDGTMVYRDAQHLSVDGSRLVAQRMGWGARIEQLAR